MRLSVYMKKKKARKAKRVKLDLRKEIHLLQKDMKAVGIPYFYRNISRLRAKELSGYYGQLKDIATREMRDFNMEAVA